MTTRTVPTRDVTLADGRCLYYQHDESRRHAEAGTHASVYLTKRGPDGALRILITVDDAPDYGEHYHLSGSYPERTPTPDEMMTYSICGDREGEEDEDEDAPCSHRLRQDVDRWPPRCTDIMRHSKVH